MTYYYSRCPFKTLAILISTMSNAHPFGSCIPFEIAAVSSKVQHLEEFQIVRYESLKHKNELPSGFCSNI